MTDRKVANGVIRSAYEALSIISHAPLDIVSLARLRTAKRLLEPYGAPIEEEMRAIVERFGHETLPGVFEIPPVNRALVEAATRPFLAAEVEISFSVRPLDINVLQVAGLRLSLHHLEMLGIVNGESVEESPE
jgi:hypothetical protein